MKKLYNFVRSMKFGLILLLVVVGFSVVGSLIPQTFDEPWYIENYPSFGQFIINLGLHRMFSQWYFIIVCVLLGLSLAIATIARFKALRKILPATLDVPTSGYRNDTLDDEKVSRLRTYLQRKRYRELNTGEATVYHKNRLGYFGSAIVHLSLLLILIFGGLVLSLSYYNDVFLFPGETAVLSDGSTMHLFDFTRRDPVTGREESISTVQVTTPDGRNSGVREIRVNQPLRFNSYVFYQFHHVYAGSITAVDTETGGSDHFFLTEPSLLTMDGITGIWFHTVYQGWRLDEETAQMVIIFYDAPGYFPNPLYSIVVVEDFFTEQHRFAIPGSHIHVGNIRYEFNDLVHYPGIRVNFSPQPFPVLLVGAAVLLMVGLALAFYFTPAVIVLKGGQYKITASKSSGLEMDIIATIYEGEDLPAKTPEIDETDETKPDNPEREVDI